MKNKNFDDEEFNLLISELMKNKKISKKKKKELKLEWIQEKRKNLE